MAERLTLDAVEVHAEGEPGRVVTNAAGLVRGDSMAERLAYCRSDLDWLRRFLLHEPRGYPALCAVLLLPPVKALSDFGIVVLEQGGFTPMSGSNTICAVTAALETGIVTVPAGATQHEIRIDTAVGTIVAQAQLVGTKVAAVTIHNVPAYVVELDVPLNVPEIGTIEVDIAFGGQFYAQTDVGQVGLELDGSRAKELARAGALIKLAANEQIRVTHPLTPEVSGVSLVMLHSGPRVAGTVARNTVVLDNCVLRADEPQTWTGALDRSPCGTGTSARMAALHARGQLGLDEDFVHRSIIGSEFVGRLVGETTVGDQPAVLPTITGRGWVTGQSRWVLDDTDPFPTGYTLGDIWGPA